MNAVVQEFAISATTATQLCAIAFMGMPFAVACPKPDSIYHVHSFITMNKIRTTTVRGCLKL